MPGAPVKAKDIARWAIMAFHFLGGTALLIGVIVNFDPPSFRSWGVLSLLFLCLPLLMIGISLGFWLQRRWVRWLAIPMLLILVAFTFVMLAGSVLWPESFAYGIITVSGILIAIEVSTFLLVRTFPTSI